MVKPNVTGKRTVLARYGTAMPGKVQRKPVRLGGRGAGGGTQCIEKQRNIPWDLDCAYKVFAHQARRRSGESACFSCSKAAVAVAAATIPSAIKKHTHTRTKHVRHVTPKKAFCDDALLQVSRQTTRPIYRLTGAL